MAGPGTRSVLYRLIEAGQVARRTLLAPLQERGLEAGDDALLFLLHEHPGVAEADVAAAVGIETQALRERLDHLRRGRTQEDLESRVRAFAQSVAHRYDRSPVTRAEWDVAGGDSMDESGR